MRKQRSSANAPMGCTTCLSHQITRPPGKRKPTQLKPAGGEHPKTPPDLDQTRTRNLVMRGDKSLRSWKAGLDNHSGAMIESRRKFGSRLPVKFKVIVMATVLNNVVAGII